MNGNCHDCGIYREWLHKHHLKLQSEGGTDADGLLWLCSNCHEDRHKGPCGGQGRGRKAHSPEAQAKRAMRMKELWSDPTYRAKQTASRVKMWETRDRKKQAEVMAKIWTPEKREMHSKVVSRAMRESGQGWKSDPKNRLRLSIHMRHVWAQQKLADSKATSS